MLLIALWLPGFNQGGYRVDTGLYAALGLHAWREGPMWPLFAGDAPYFNKPPMVLWIHGVFLWTLGTDLWVARLPSLLAAAACVMATRRAVGYITGPRGGLLAACILALTLEFFRYTRAISLDLWMTLFLMLACCGVARGLRTRGGGIGFILRAGVPVGLALLTKPIAPLLALPIFALWIASRKEDVLRRLGALAGSAIIALLVAALWYVPMYLRFGDAFVHQHFTRQAVERATGESFGADPWWYYLRLMSETYWPWMIGVAATAFLLVRGRFGARDRRAALMGLSWAGVWLIALSAFAGKSGRYAVPMYPMLAWAAALALAAATPRWLGLVRRAMIRWLAPAMLAVSMALTAFGVRVHSPPTPHWQALYEFVRAHADQAIWSAPDIAPTCANIYLHTGRWPRSIASDGATPGPGDILILRDESEFAPDPSWREFWRSGPVFALERGDD